MPQVMMDRSSSEDIMADSHSHSHSAPFLVGPTTSSASASASSADDDGFPSVRRRSLREAARFLRHASSRRMMMRQPSVAVREAAAAQLEERQSDWAYSKPVVILDVVWNVIFVVVAITVLVMSVGESPGVPLRLWLVGYAIQCGLHVFCVIVEFRRRQRLRRRMSLSPSPPSFESVMRFGSSGDDSSSGSRRNSGQQYDTFPLFHEEGAGAGAGSTAKHLESANTMFSFVWWIIGFYWVSSNTQALANESPQLYWLCIVFLALDVFFVIFCVALACIIGIAVCCCLPCIIAILYAVADQEGATKQDIEQLLKFKFRRIDKDKVSGSTQGPVGGVMTECGTDLPTDRVLSEEDAECCICLSAYEDGVELRELPCGHHFHCACVDKWLYINATCPLCKYNVLKGSNNAQEEV